MGPDHGSEPLPPLYARWVAELLGGAIPREAAATCDECAMCVSGAEAPGPGGIYFDRVVKCCTYLPELHNFLVGRILSDPDPAAQPGRSTVAKRIAAGIGVTPLGLAQSPVFSLLYRNSEDAFGQSRTLCCPHYLEEGGRCGIWRNRDSTCSTWFCKHVRGKIGWTFWRDSLHQLLLVVEEDLARWCVLELHPSDDTLRQVVASTAEAVTGESLDNRVNQETYACVWGEWRGREGEFFLRCAELVNPLSWAEVLAISGPKVRAYAQLTERAYGRLISDDVPPALLVGSIQLVQIQQGTTRVNTYSDYDPLDVPSIVMELLHYFDGRPTEDAIAAIAQERGFRLEPALVRKMVDFGLLVQPKQ